MQRIHSALIDWQQDLIVALLIVTVLSIITMSLVVSREVNRLDAKVAKFTTSQSSCPK